MYNHSYKPVSLLAVWSMVFGLVSIWGVVAPVFFFALLLSVPLGVTALWSIRKHEMKGVLPASLGIIVGLSVATWTPTRHYLAFCSEAPWGYQRLDFDALMSSDGSNLDEFLGEKICLKGYPTIPKNWSETRLVGLTPDGNLFRSGTLVVVEISPEEQELQKGQSISVSGRLVRFEGAGNSEYKPRYLLKQSTIRPCKTQYGLVNRTSGQGCSIGCQILAQR